MKSRVCDSVLTEEKAFGTVSAYENAGGVRG